MIDKDYNYVLVGGNSPKYLWILSRTPQLDEATLQKIIDVAEEKGYDTDKLIFVEQWTLIYYLKEKTHQQYFFISKGIVDTSLQIADR